jgi:hypothetical protein
VTKTDLFYEGRFMGGFGSPWIDHSSKFLCPGCGRVFAERRTNSKYDWSFNIGYCAKCANKRLEDEFYSRSLAFFRLGGEVVHPFECKELDCLQFIYEAECLLGAPDVSNPITWPDECSFRPAGGVVFDGKFIAELDFNPSPQNPPDGR